MTRSRRWPRRRRRRPPPSEARASDTTERYLPSGLADRYLARNAVEAQVTDEPIDAYERLDILFEPADVDIGAHGPFDDRALDRSLHYEVSRRKGLIAAGVSGAALLAAGAAFLLRRRDGAG